MSAVVAVFPSGSIVSYEVSQCLLQEKYVEVLMGISSNGAYDDLTDPDSFHILVNNAPHIDDSELTWKLFWNRLPVLCPVSKSVCLFKYILWFDK